MFDRFSCHVAPPSGCFYLCFPRPLQCRPQGGADELMDRLIGQGAPIFLPQPRPDGCVTGEAIRVGQAVAKDWLPLGGQQGSLAWGLGHREPLAEASGRLRGQPAPHGIPTAPEQVGHLATGAGLLGLEAIEGLQASAFVGTGLGAEERVQFLWRFADRRTGHLHGELLRSAIMAL
jgi:hypothetical protein